jgi:branched-chain amino acid transport system ATP-binding protein
MNRWAAWITPRWTRRPTCWPRSGTRGVTIVWVEHIMGVLMRVVDRCVVLDHGEVIAQGKPAGRIARPEGHRGLPGTDAFA